MKNQIFKGLMILAVLAIFFPLPGKAEEEKISIHLKVAAGEEIVYDNTLEVLACPETADSATSTLNAMCAIMQSGLESDWSYWGESAFLDSLSGYANNSGGNGIYWQWFSDLEYGQTALNSHILTEEEDLLLSYGVNPLKLEISESAPKVNATSTISLFEFGLDENWMPVWNPAAESALNINGAAYNNPTGNYELFISTSSPYIIYGERAGCINSRSLTITPLPLVVEEEPEQEEEEEEQNHGSSGGGGSYGGGTVIPPAPSNIDSIKLANFLLANQKENGSMPNIMITDWTAIALAAEGGNAEKIKKYLLTDPHPGNLLTDYERRAMALMSLRVNPYNGTKTNYISKITEQYANGQSGDAENFNDDIFAILILRKAGYTAEDAIFTGALSQLLSAQRQDNGWGSVDLTAAAIEALLSVRAREGAENAITRAKLYLKEKQGQDAGFGNSFSTSWALQAIYALGENENDWKKNGKTPLEFLTSLQDSDGGLDSPATDKNTRVWASAYALPAGLKKSWTDILMDFPLPAGMNPENENSGTNSENINAESEQSDKDDDKEGNEDEEPQVEEADEDLEKMILGEKISNPGEDETALDKKFRDQALRPGLSAYSLAFGRAPESEADWEDVIKIASGRWPGRRNEDREAAAKKKFLKIYRHEADMDDPHENAFITIAAYGLLPARKLKDESAALKSFIAVYGRTPENLEDWNIVRAIAYSGAKRR
ncbi:MAG: prenyltransferase/squalene oxidase repeat-containing protein [Patescibacteria group bacterium]|jgi:hypothetical protein